jgi:hypothetical protein
VIYELPSGAVCQYLARFNLAVYVAAVPGRCGPPVLIGTATDIRRSIREAARPYLSLHEGAELAWAGWCPADFGRRICQRVAARGGHSALLSMDVAGAVAAIEEAAGAYHIGFADHAKTLARIDACVERIARKVEVQRRLGSSPKRAGYVRVR